MRPFKLYSLGVFSNISYNYPLNPPTPTALSTESPIPTAREVGFRWTCHNQWHTGQELNIAVTGILKRSYLTLADCFCLQRCVSSRLENMIYESASMTLQLFILLWWLLPLFLITLISNRNSIIARTSIWKETTVLKNEYNLTKRLTKETLQICIKRNETINRMDSTAFSILWGNCWENDPK